MKNSLSKQKEGSVPWNKGLVLEDTTAYKEAAKKREEKYNLNLLKRRQIFHSDETKKRISSGVQKYAVQHHEELSQRARTALQTKKEKGYDLAIFKGKKHRAESKRKISISSKKNAETQTKSANERLAKNIKEMNLTLLVDIDTRPNLTVSCNKCNTKFTYTRQMFRYPKISNVCRTCFPYEKTYRSSGEIEVFEYVKSLCPDAVSNCRTIIQGEIDIFVPSLNIGIEYNGLYWHSQTVLEANGRDKWNDYKKYIKLQNKGIKSILIYEDEWHNKQDIVKARLKHILGKSSKKIYARKCTVNSISSKISSEFCNKYHLQGNGRTNERYGLFYNNELVAVMTFSLNNLSRKIKNWELNRFCTVDNISIVGGAGKLFSTFLREHNPESVLSYADKRWSEGNLYNTLGFTRKKDTTPGYWYFLPNQYKRFHRFALRKNKNDDQNLSEYENRLLEGYLRIWDCGNSKWIWKNAGI